MLAMQYSFTLPADYDMGIIRDRIAGNGHLMDGFPGLAFKAYLHACRTRPGHDSRENLYAPFYVWDGNEGMNRFLAGAGFAALADTFGWPSVRVWSVWHLQQGGELAEARWATRQIVALPAHASLTDRQRKEASEGAADVDRRAAVASVVGFEPTTWTLVRFQLWRARPEQVEAAAQLYEVGHVSPGAAGSSI